MERKLRPSHPGDILKRVYMDPIGVTPAEFARNLGVASRTLYRIIGGESPITVETALRLSQALKTTPELWMNLQTNHDLFYAKKKKSGWQKVKKITHSRS